MKYIIPIAMLFVLAGMASGTMWLYDDPTFFMPGSQIRPSSANYSIASQFDAGIGSFKPAELSPFEIINAPFFPLIGRGFSFNTAPAQAQNQSSTVMIGSTGKLDNTPEQLTFSGGMENNLKYAGTKSSLRVGQQGSWTNLNTPWLVQ